ncbi:hypothetical protein K435DRAFT_787227, partial [Dendrothele bispora CBS 962.96]
AQNRAHNELPVREFFMYHPLYNCISVKPKARTVNVADRLLGQLQQFLPKWLPRCTARGVKVRCAYRGED